LSRPAGQTGLALERSVAGEQTRTFDRFLASSVRCRDAGSGRLCYVASAGVVQASASSRRPRDADTLFYRHTSLDGLKAQRVQTTSVDTTVLAGHTFHRIPTIFLFVGGLESLRNSLRNPSTYFSRLVNMQTVGQDSGRDRPPGGLPRGCLSNSGSLQTLHKTGRSSKPSGKVEEERKGHY
jgi:hypothetical protein